MATKSIILNRGGVPMSSAEFATRLTTNNVVQQDPVTEAFQVEGVDIPPAIPIAWADFILLDWTQLGGLFYIVTDVHSVGSTGGSLWMADATGDRPVLKDGPLQYATLALAPDPTLYPGLRILPADVGHICKSDGVGYVSEVPGLLGLKTDSTIKLICPNAAITWTAADNGSGKVRLTASGVHGLTTTPAVGAHLAATATQNGWVSGDFHEIATIVNTTTIDLTTNWASQGVPVFALVGTNVTLYSLAIPVLLANSYLEIDCCFTSSGLLTTNKNPTIQLDGTYNLYNPVWNTAQTLIHPALILMQNANSVSIQRGETITSNIGAGSAQSGNVPADGTINTGAETTLTFGAAPTVNEWVNLRRARVMLKR